MIDSLRLEGFKSFRDATLPLGPFTVIVGTNASGKSNLRDAFRFLHGIGRGIAAGYSLTDIVGGRRDEGWLGIRGGPREVAWGGQRHFCVETVLHNDHEPECQYRIGVDTGDEVSPLRLAQESFYRDRKVVFDSHSREHPLQQDDRDSLSAWVVGLDPDKSGNIATFPAVWPLARQLGVYKHAGFGLRSYVDLLVREFSAMRFLDFAPEAMKEPSFFGQPLGDHGENLASALQRNCGDERRRKTIVSWLRHLMPLDVVDLKFLPDLTGRMQVFLVESSGQQTSAYSASDGTLRFLGFLAALQSPDASKFYFIEEIENGIHPTRLSLLVELIEHHAKENQVQVVATTHSPLVLAMLSDESREHACLTYRFDDEKESHISRIVDLPHARQVLEEQNLARLQESGWLENVVAFSREEPVDT